MGHCRRQRESDLRLYRPVQNLFQYAIGSRRRIRAMIDATSNYLTADANTSKKPVFIITVEGYSRAFSNVASVSGFGSATLVDWLINIEDMQTTVNDLDGGTDLADFIFTVQDRDALLTASFPT